MRDLHRTEQNQSQKQNEIFCWAKQKQKQKQINAQFTHRTKLFFPVQAFVWAFKNSVNVDSSVKHIVFISLYALPNPNEAC